MGSPRVEGPLGAGRCAALLVGAPLSPAEVVAAFGSFGGLRAGDFSGADAPQLAVTTGPGGPVSVIGLPLWDEGGLRVLDEATVPGPEVLDAHIGRALTARGATAVFVAYDEERGAGGYLRFDGGVPVSRLVFDGRGRGPVRRTLTAVTDEPDDAGDGSEWLWGRIEGALREGAAPFIGPVPDASAWVEWLANCAFHAVPLPAPAAAPLPPPPAAAAPPRKRDRLLGALRRIVGD